MNHKLRRQLRVNQRNIVRGEFEVKPRSPQRGFDKTESAEIGIVRCQQHGENLRLEAEYRATDYRNDNDNLRLTRV